MYPGRVGATPRWPCSPPRRILRRSARRDSEWCACPHRSFRSDGFVRRGGQPDIDWDRVDGTTYRSGGHPGYDERELKGPSRRLDRSRHRVDWRGERAPLGDSSEPPIVAEIYGIGLRLVLASLLHGFLVDDTGASHTRTPGWSDISRSPGTSGSGAMPADKGEEDDELSFLLESDEELEE